MLYLSLHNLTLLKYSIPQYLYGSTTHQILEVKNRRFFKILKSQNHKPKLLNLFQQLAVSNPIALEDSMEL